MKTMNRDGWPLWELTYSVDGAEDITRFFRPTGDDAAEFAAEHVAELATYAGDVVRIVSLRQADKEGTVEVWFDGYSHRRTMKMKSPTGRTLTLDCHGRWGEMSESMTEFVMWFNTLNSDQYKWRTWSKKVIPYTLMAEFKKLVESK